MHIERPALGAQLLGRPVVSTVSGCLCAGHCLPFPRSALCHREPDPCFPRLPCYRALDQVWPIKSIAWGLEAGGKERPG